MQVAESHLLHGGLSVDLRGTDIDVFPTTFT
jgi:hypothetical protein